MDGRLMVECRLDHPTIAEFRPYMTGFDCQFQRRRATESAG
jgi:hypothetical protein